MVLLGVRLITTAAVLLISVASFAAAQQTTVNDASAETTTQPTTEAKVEEDGDNNTECPPIPNCDRGYTCREIKPHPDYCPICKCVPCENKPCTPEKGYGCVFVQDSTGCSVCRCTKCPDLGEVPCEEPCRRTKSSTGCPYCKCPSTTGDPASEGGEVEGNQSEEGDNSAYSFEP